MGLPSKIASSVSLAFLVAGFFFDSALARRAYSTAEAEGETIAAAKAVNAAPVRKPRRKAKAKLATAGAKAAAAGAANRAASAGFDLAASTSTKSGSSGLTAPDPAVGNMAAAGHSGGSAPGAVSEGSEGAGKLSKLLSEAEEAARAENYEKCTAIMNDCLKALTANGSARGLSIDAAAPVEPRETVDKAGAEGTAESLKQMAAVYSLMERPDAAARCMEEALRLNSRQPAFLAQAVECLSNDGQFASACRLAEDYLEGHRNKNLSRALALTQARMGEFEKALATINSGFGGNNRNNTEVSEVKAEILSAVGDYGEALDVYEGLERNNPEEAFYPASAAELLRKLGKLDQALSRCDAALKLSPLDPGALACRVRILRDLCRYEEAVKAVSDLVRIAPQSSNYLLAAEVFDASGAYERGLKAVEDGLDRLGPQPELELARLSELVNLGKGESAIDEALAQDPGRLSYQLLKLRMLIKNGQLAEAKKLGVRLKSTSGWTVATRLALARLAMVQGHYMPAARALEPALRILPRGDQRRFELELLLSANYLMAGEKTLAKKTLSALAQEVESTVEGGYPSSLVASLMAADTGAPILEAKGQGKVEQVQSGFYRGMRLLADGKTDAGREVLQSIEKIAAPSSVEAALVPRILEGPGKSGFLTGLLSGVPGWNYLLPVMLTIWSLVGGGIFLYKYRKRGRMVEAERRGPGTPRVRPQAPLRPVPPQPAQMPSQPSGVPQPAQMPSQPSGVPQPAQMPSQPSGVPQPAQMPSQPSGVPQPAQMPSQPSGVPQPAQMLQAAMPEAAPRRIAQDLQQTQVEDLSAVRVPAAIDEEKELDSSQNRRRYFSSFCDASASVEEIWNERLARLQMEGHGHTAEPGGASAHVHGHTAEPGGDPAQSRGQSPPAMRPHGVQVEPAGVEAAYVDEPRPIELGAVGLRPVRGGTGAGSPTFEPLWPGQELDEDAMAGPAEGLLSEQERRLDREKVDLEATELDLAEVELEQYSLPPESTLPPSEI